MNEFLASSDVSQLLVLWSGDMYRKVSKGVLGLGWWLGIACEPLVDGRWVTMPRPLPRPQCFAGKE